jgi:uncharacterized protein YdhG (YjbR/CyaY superfamily)
MAQQFDTVGEYIASFAPDVQAVLEEIRQSCHAAVPDAGETISYGIPTITLEGKHGSTSPHGRAMSPCIRFPTATRRSARPSAGRPRGR